jgi:hypothetical protein
MHVNFSYWCKVASIALSYMWLILWMQIALINIVIFRSNIEFVSLIFREIHAMSIDILNFSSSLWLVQLEIKVHLWLIKHTKAPKAELAIIRNTNNIMGICRTYNCQWIYWMIMSIFGQTRFLNRLSFGSNIPLKNISWVSCSNHNVWLKWIEYCFCDFILRC